MQDAHFDDDLSPVVNRFEQMLRNNEAYYFEKHDLEDIVDYYMP